MKIATIAVAATLGLAALAGATPAAARDGYRHGWHGGYHHGYYGHGYGYRHGGWRHHDDWRWRHRDWHYRHGYRRHW